MTLGEPSAPSKGKRTNTRKAGKMTWTKARIVNTCAVEYEIIND